ncbi:carboxylating nicotinate-nucleotide diphosphorylase [uncultured Nocardioides sp.]|uniref:carboxylating nicotinate-nucleotide diphosphorylase n=1 Tax=uncultured Nocardioides sp. TaxID=198441 RepID=UPI00262E48A0|nr:carboxylating nicotinate-nucleotide diphosphorylase [uncultured Nocardioides sp.]
MTPPETVRAIAAPSYDALPPALLDELSAAGLDPATVHASVVAAVAEDLPGGVDVTSWSTIPADQVETADLVARAPGTLAGLAVAELVFRHVLGAEVEVVRGAADGEAVVRGDVVLTVTGATALLLTAERTALNYLGHLSGIATATAAWVAALDGTGARVRDTRKTVPHLRSLAKYAVRAGGGLNHRRDLSDQGLVKDNHVLAAGGVVDAYALVRSAHPDLPVQVEVTTLEQLVDLVERTDCTDVLLDNMDVDTTAEAVRLNREAAARAGRAPARLEASGGLDLAAARAVGETGVDLLAVGALTHSAPVLDIAMDLRAPA